MKTCWILTSEINAYDQEGEYFIDVFENRPTPDQLYQLLSTCGLRHNQEQTIQNILVNGGTTVDGGDAWWYLREEVMK